MSKGWERATCHAWAGGPGDLRKQAEGTIGANLKQHSLVSAMLAASASAGVSALTSLHDTL